jgi:hypothetical protein
MAGINYYKRGAHPSREGVTAGLSGEEFAHFHKQVLSLIGPNRPLLRDIVWLIDAVAMARAESLRADACAVTPNDTRRQLKSMLSLEPSALLEALRNCDELTLLAINEAQEQLIWEILLTNGAFIDAKGCKHTSSSHPILLTSPNCPIHLPMGFAGTKQAIQRALIASITKTGVKGPKLKKHQTDLALESIKFWRKHRPLRSPGRLAFVTLVFTTAKIHLGSKRLEALITAATRR